MDPGRTCFFLQNLLSRIQIEAGEAWHRDSGWTGWGELVGTPCALLLPSLCPGAKRAKENFKRCIEDVLRCFRRGAYCLLHRLRSIAQMFFRDETKAFGFFVPTPPRGMLPGHCCRGFLVPATTETMSSCQASSLGPFTWLCVAWKHSAAAGGESLITHVKGTPVRLHEVQLQTWWHKMTLTHHWCGSTWKIYLLDLVCVFTWTSCCLVCSWAPKKLHWDVGIHQFFFLEKMHHGLHIICTLDCLIPEQIVQYSLSSVSSLTSFICSLVISSLLHSFASRILGRLPPLLTLQHFLWLFWSCFIPALLELSSQHDNTCVRHEKSWIPVVDVWNRQRQPSYLCLRTSLSIAGFLVALLAPFICSLPDPSFDIAAPLPEKCVEARVSLKFIPKSSHQRLHQRGLRLCYPKICHEQLHHHQAKQKAVGTFFWGQVKIWNCSCSVSYMSKVLVI